MLLVWLAVFLSPRSFLDATERELARLSDEAGEAEWARWTEVTPEHERAAAEAGARLAAFVGKAAREARRRIAARPDATSARRLALLLRAVVFPAPAWPGAAEELAAISARLADAYATTRTCVGTTCKDVGQVSEILRESRDPDELRRWWTARHDAAAPARVLWARQAALGNLGARDLGFADVGAQWRSDYEMPPEAFRAEVARLWREVRPLYVKLHCHVRAELARAYPGHVDARGPIPAHLLGNLWAQDWRGLHPLVAPKLARPTPDVGAALVDAHVDARGMVRLAERFFLSLGFEPLPPTFWQRSRLTDHGDGEKNCQPAAFALRGGEDVRLSMCLRPVEKDLIDLHHELGHTYYSRATRHLPFLYQDSPHDGFHEAIGDAIALSIAHGSGRGRGDNGDDEDEDARRDRLLRLALDKLPFLAFSVALESWRWEVYAGTIPPTRWNRSWWETRRAVQGIAPPVPRDETRFDPAAKFHVASSHRYIKYFLSLILQFQLHEALCRARPLDRCSIAGDARAGERLRALLRLGASRPWPEALQAIAGTRRMEAGPTRAYFAPLEAWLDEQSRGRACDWPSPPDEGSGDLGTVQPM